MENMKCSDEVTKDEMKEIASVFMALPKSDRVILLSNANAFATLRNLEKENSKP